MKFLILLYAVFSCAFANASAGLFDRVITVVLENGDFQEVLKNPFMARLADEGVLLHRMYSVARLSQPNYIAMIAGDTFAADNSLIELNKNHLGDLLEAKGLDWRVYAEEYPGDCYLGKRSGRYVRRQIPFLSFSNVTKDRARCGKIKNFFELSDDIVAGSLPAYSLVIPNLWHNGHDSTIGFSAHWLRFDFLPLLRGPQMKRTLVIITYDDGSSTGSSHIYTVLLGDVVRAGSNYTGVANHYSILRLIEDVFQLGTLGRNDQNANPITGIWK